jgi:hypothetical protein
VTLLDALPRGLQKQACDLAQDRLQSQALLAHACNPSYSGGSDQKDLCLKPARADSS